MSAFRDIRKATAPVPTSVVVLQPGHFADTWPQKPVEPVPVGLRLVSERDLQVARSEAAKRAWADFPEPDQDEDDRTDAFNDALAAWVVACGTTQPDDATKPWLDMAHDNVQAALTSGGIHFLFDQLVALYTERSPLSPEATDGELVRLCDALHTGAAWSAANGNQVRHARRLLRRVMDLLSIG